MNNRSKRASVLKKVVIVVLVSIFTFAVFFVGCASILNPTTKDLQTTEDNLNVETPEATEAVETPLLTPEPTFEEKILAEPTADETPMPTPEETDIGEQTEEPVTQTEEPDDTDEETATYIANRNTKKFHYPSCSSVNDMKEENKWYFTGTREELIEQGYVPCKRCNP